MPRSVKHMQADAGDADHVLVPSRVHEFRMIERGAAHNRPRVPLMLPDIRGAALCTYPALRPMRRIGPTVAGERELAARLAPGAFEHDTANRSRAPERMCPRQDHGCNGALTFDRLVACLEIDGGRKTKFLAAPRHVCELGVRLADARHPPDAGTSVAANKLGVVRATSPIERSMAKV